MMAHHPSAFSANLFFEPRVLDSLRKQHHASRLETFRRASQIRGNRELLEGDHHICARSTPIQALWPVRCVDDPEMQRLTDGQHLLGEQASPQAPFQHSHCSISGTSAAAGSNKIDMISQCGLTSVKSCCAVVESRAGGRGRRKGGSVGATSKRCVRAREPVLRPHGVGLIMRRR